MQIASGTAPARSFDTQNVALANALHSGGVPWFVNERGQAVGILNDYTAATLREIDERRARVKQPALNLLSLPQEEAVRVAFRHGICGVVTYRFQWCELLERIKAGFDAQASRIAAGENLSPQVSPEDYGAICCQNTKGRKEFFGDKNTKPLWMRVPPFAVQDGIRSGTRPAKNGVEHLSEGSYSRTEVHV